VIKFDRCAEIDEPVLTKLGQYLIKDRPKRWDGKAKAVVAFKKSILDEGLVIQSGKCGWCMLPVAADGRRTAHRDHIAPKAKHPEWTFLPINLVIACEYCNGFAVKGDIDTVEIAAKNYTESVFHVIHPYLEDPSLHLSFLSEADETKILIKSLSTKGTWTIESLKLDTPGATTERAKEYLHQQRMGSLPQPYAALLREAVLALG
jgi:5-methylcytosine-specific restriction endonuclease McrA